MTDPSTPLGAMVAAGPTVLWNDSADPAELAESIGFGAVGATCNPVIALAAIRADLPRWSARIRELADEMPDASESDIGWQVVAEVSLEAAQMLQSTFAEHNGYNGRLSMQTDPRLARSKHKLVEQAVHFASLADNIIVKVPATSVGVEAIEEASYAGVAINVTVSFSAAQALATGEAIERGLRRREAEGHDTSRLGPVVTIMVGRVDDWMKEVYDREGITSFPREYLDWAGVAVFKNAYAEFKRRGLRSRLLAAAYRNLLQFSEFVGGDVVLSPPFAWQRKIQASGLSAEPRMHLDVDPVILAALKTMPEFLKAYELDGMTPAEFDSFGATRKTLRQFLTADEELDGIVRDILIPAP
ncbi:MAG: transaldolase family protein [Micropruina sp.]